MQRIVNGMIIAAMAVFLSGCAYLNLKTPQIQSVRPRITGIDLQGVSLAFDVGVDNLYPIPLRTPNFRYGMDIQGREFFKSGVTANIDLPAKSIGTVTLPVRVTYLSLWKTYQALSEAAEIQYTLRGALVLSAYNQSYELPLSHTGTFPVLRLPSFSDISVRVADASLTKAKIVIEATIKNPNCFGIDVRNLGYAFKLGDVELAGLAATTQGKLEAGGQGRLALAGEVSALSALPKLLLSGSPRAGEARIAPTGAIQTPYGAVKLPR